MAHPWNGDLVPVASGWNNIGVGVTPNAQNAFTISTLRPVQHVHLVSGVWHDPLLGQSGVIRYNRADPSFEVSLDGGLTFVDLLTAGAAVQSVGVIGGANLTGNVDFASVASGFIAITDSAGASPIFWAVNHLGLSGLWQFPTQGFNGRVVNSLTDFNGTTSQGAITVVGASGIVVDIIGQTMTITPGANVIPRCFSATFGSATTWTVTHNLGTTDVVVEVYDDSSPRQAIIPDTIVATSATVVTITFNVAQAGRVVIFACL